MTASKPMTDWEKEFDKKFTRDDGLIDKYAHDEDGELETTPVVIKAFIRKLLSQKEQEVREEEARAHNSGKTMFLRGRADMREEVVKMCEEMKTPIEDKDILDDKEKEFIIKIFGEVKTAEYMKERRLGQNRALSELQERLGKGV